MWLVVGLGNPGPKYAATRHNVGFMVVDQLAARLSAPAFREKSGAEVVEANLRGEKILIAKPMEFMNVSGQSTGRLATFHKIPAQNVLVIHDELDIPFGRLRVAASGGSGGHNGLKSIASAIGGNTYPRIRVGIGRPPTGWDPADYVLAKFATVEQKDLPQLIDLVADAIEIAILKGIPAAMNQFNGKQISPE